MCLVTFYLIFNFYLVYLCFLFEDAVLFVFFFHKKENVFGKYKTFQYRCHALLP